MRLVTSALLLAALSVCAIACTQPNPGIQSDPQSPVAIASVAPAKSTPPPPEAPSAIASGNAAPGTLTPRHSTSAKSAKDEDDVREATFRHVMGKNASGQSSGAALYCLEVENAKDPSPAFLHRFHDVSALMRPVSACDASADHGVIDKATGKRGLVLRIESMTFIDDDHVDVEGGYYEAGLSASGNTYSLERKSSGTWTVTNDVMHWIS